MPVVVGAVVPLDESRRRRHDLLAELREVDHWRRLVTARLDLAVAAVTAIDEPSHRRPGTGAGLPIGLREMIGLPAHGQALPEAGRLVRLRAAQRELDEYAGALRASTDLATLELAALLDATRRLHRPARTTRPARAARRARTTRLAQISPVPQSADPQSADPQTAEIRPAGYAGYPHAVADRRAT